MNKAQIRQLREIFRSVDTLTRDRLVKNDTESAGGARYCAIGLLLHHAGVSDARMVDKGNSSATVELFPVLAKRFGLTDEEIGTIMTANDEKPALEHVWDVTTNQYVYRVYDERRGTYVDPTPERLTIALTDMSRRAPDSSRRTLRADPNNPKVAVLALLDQWYKAAKGNDAANAAEQQQHDLQS